MQRSESPSESKPVPATDDSPADCRCLCGSLLARVIASGVELKCRRCKRTLLVPLSAADLRDRPAGFEPVAVREIG